MSLENIRKRLEQTAAFAELRKWCSGPHSENKHLRIEGAVGSIQAFLVAQTLSQTSGRAVLCLTTDNDEASYLQSDVDQILGADAETGVLVFPPTSEQPFDPEHVADPEPQVQRSTTLSRIRNGFNGIIISSIEAVFAKVPPPELVHAETIHLSIGDLHVPGELVNILYERGFEHVDFVEQPGDFALRGGILDVFPFSGSYPTRIEFFGDEIDSLREFDPKSQKSVSRLTDVYLVPNVQRTGPAAATGYTSLFSYLPEDTILFLVDPARFQPRLQERYEHMVTERDELARRRTSDVMEASNVYLAPGEFREATGSFSRISAGSFKTGEATHKLHIAASPQPDFNASIKLLREKLIENTRTGLDTTILCDSKGQAARLEELLGEPGGHLKYSLRADSLHKGFEFREAGLAVYTDHQIFNRYHRPSTRKRKKAYGGISLRELRQLSPGDYVTHIDYGIGKFAGLEHIEIRGKHQEAVRLLFRDEDVLYVNVNAIHKLHRYSGKDTERPKLTKLGTGEWERAKTRTKRKVKALARDLIQLYARRRQSEGYAFSKDATWQHEMEASFQYEDTPDQADASNAVKKDMQAPVPMDRLVCGDVGFGKTEIAVRAAFKAVQDGKQVAMLVPTTILAAQHYETFRSRLKNYPVKVEMLSRFRTLQQQKPILEGLREGRIDILIGTHRIISKDVLFKALGLLIVDEEQRFGVGVKEKLREMRVNIDTLTLTATPIPRTLQFSLLGARDLSIINTPPPNRQPIQTEIHTFDKDLVRDAILYEINRGGQVFFIHNRVQSIDETAGMLRMLIPNITMEIAHGQMKPSQLERVMHGFMSGKFDVLVSTNIIENGLDIANANTIIINRADRFGLAELHQLRGRVGRSDRKAFCYLLTPSIHTLTREARQRLQAVEEFSDLGGGFNLAMRDLDIRGAGSLLGAEQSGFIEEVGYETYHKILDESVQELRAEEFGHLFDEKAIPPAAETVVDIDEDAYLPDTYISSTVERLNIYRRLNEASDSAGLAEIRNELEDRFGPVPAEVDNLVKGVEIKILLQPLRLPRVQFKNQRLFLELPPESDKYFYDNLFHPLLETLNQLEQRFVLKDSKKKLRIIIQDVAALETALQVASRVIPRTAEPVHA